MALQPQKMGDAYTIVDVIDRVLDKGIVINADIMVSLVGVELLEIRLRAALASFETAAKYGLALPTGTQTELPAWKAAQISKESCPQCEKKIPVEELLTEGCPWCGWKSAHANRLRASLVKTARKK